MTINESGSEDDIARRRDEALRRALNTPPQPKHGSKNESKAPASGAEAKPKTGGRSASES
jgi:hypothetical protein